MSEPTSQNGEGRNPPALSGRGDGRSQATASRGVQREGVEVWGL